MKMAAIYCRVSTEDQEREGTSLQTQLDACLSVILWSLACSLEHIALFSTLKRSNLNLREGMMILPREE